MGTDSQSEHEQPSAHQNEQTCYDYEYVTSSSLEDLRHLKILPAKPMVTQSVYADKRCLPARPPPRSPNNGQPLDHRPQAAFRQQSIVNVQPSTQYKSNNEDQTSYQLGYEKAKVKTHLVEEPRGEMIFQDPFTRRKPQASRDLQKPKLLSSPAAKDLEGQIWYFGACDRYKIEEALRLHNKNGTFLVRDSSKGYPDKPYVLVVYYRFKVYSIQIRYLEDTNQYALGSGLRGHDIFDSVPEIINIHKNIPLRLIDRRDQSGSQMEQCTLTFPLILH
ncbi:hypothetical protein chiPu_0004808 [Chiloscyllium punctatum]|uniref:SH2 domain-containing protein n=1 Tax=Chiloscyllium punctatum TaxID=137246 RepID=A0A401S7L9_CHIPU|nr:hypothetical protein [Chiloscyllium punctatum]